MKCVFEVSLNEDLSMLSQLLWQNGIQHRVIEANGCQQLWIVDAQYVDSIRRLYEQIKQRPEMMLELGEELQKVQRRQNQSLLSRLIEAPVTALLIGLSAIWFIAALLGYVDLFGNALWFIDYTAYPAFSTEVRLSSWLATLGDGEVWRLITPIFIHGGWLHIGFNLAIFFFFANQIEQLQGSGRVIILILVIAAVSNLAQYLVTGPRFGGMSGVVFGLASYCWHINERSSQPLFLAPRGLFVFMLIWLALGFAGALDALLMGSIANMAHLFGLLAGLFLAQVTLSAKPELR